VTVSEAALGAKVEVPTLAEGMVVVTIPPGTSSGAKLRLRGKGVIDRTTKERGDQFAVVKIVVPRQPGERAVELLEELARVEPQSPRRGLW
jgi:DnaJ-class molecular chaperone